MTKIYPPHIYQKILGALDKAIRKVDPRIPWRQQLAGMIRKMRRGEVECDDAGFIRALRFARDAEPDNMVFRYVLSRAIMEIGEIRDAELWESRYAARNLDIRRRLGIDPEEDFLRGEGPPELREMNAEYEHEGDRLIIAAFREFGEHESADLFERDPKTFFEEGEPGRKLIFGSLHELSGKLAE